ncbi:MAG: hypothetical protein GXY25_15140 [Pirellulaceae bacterium]|jgi:ribonuclease HI|nr:hypothetical protein [Pirellulaceae bacterium]
MRCVERPEYVLFSESRQATEPGRWRFVLRAEKGGERIVADDIDPVARGDRLELLTVVRGLEALRQPSCVTIWTASSYVREGIRYGLHEWRENGWCWEYFGQMVPVKNGDLWKRLDRAMQFHQVDCRTWRIDPAHAAQSSVSDRSSRSISEGPRSEKPEGLRHLLATLLPIKSVLKSVCGYSAGKSASGGSSPDWVTY